MYSGDTMYMYTPAPTPTSPPIAAPVYALDLDFWSSDVY